jgi:amino acid adenylation domain-containing protein
MRSAESTNYALTVAVMPGRSLTIDIGCDADRFEAETITRMLGHLHTLLQGMIVDPQQPIGKLPLLTEAEQAQLMEWNQTATPFPHDKCLHQLFAERVQQTPEAVAVTFEGQQLSYRELNNRANQLAHHLQQLGVGVESRVGICVERSMEMIVAVLGVMKAGGAYVPLDAQYPRERLRFMLDDTQSPVLLTQKRLLDVVPTDRVRVVCLDADWELIAKEPATAPKNTVKPDNLAYVIYTSGSTGQPKGVLIQHRGVVNFALACARFIGMTSQDRMLQFSSLSFDASVTEIFMTLLAGATLCLARREELISAPDLVRILREQGITTLLLPPSMLKLMSADDLPALRSLFSAGEACTREIVEQWAPGRCLYNAYGPTETTVGPTIYPVEDPEQLGDIVPIGRAISNMAVYILDERRHAVPIGVPGELYIAGVGLARGYLNRPELTAERFVELGTGDWGLGTGDRSFQPPAPIRMYKTGDSARFLPDGNIEYLGRLDHQVKLRGFRIELGEIEALLEQHPAVQQAAVLAREHESGDKRLVAYIVAPADAAPVFEELRAFLQQKLPDYMLPAAVVRLDALPLTPNGKVDRKGLPAPDGTRPQLRCELVAPRDLVESQLVRIWEEVLEVRPIGVTDNFFELGGHSLLAVRIIGQIQQRADVSLPLVTLFQNPTIEGLASALRRQQVELPNSTIVTLQAGVPARRPIFFVHPSGGSVHWYLKLAGALGADQPFYGIQAKGLSGEEDLHTRIEDMAAYYIAAMREVQPQGPYRLGSWSMGVIFVYEMARQLAAQGEEVALLAIFDQGPDVPGVSPESGAEYLMQVFGKHIPIEMERLAPLTDEEQVAYILEVARRSNWIHPDMTDGQFGHFVTMLKTHTQAWWNYELKTYPGRVTLFRASEQAADHTPPSDWGWGRLVSGGVEIHEVPGDHISMIDEPQVQVLAERLRACIDRVQEYSTTAQIAE